MLCITTDRADYTVLRVAGDSAPPLSHDATIIGVLNSATGKAVLVDADVADEYWGLTVVQIPSDAEVHDEFDFILKGVDATDSDEDITIKFNLIVTDDADGDDPDPAADGGDGDRGFIGQEQSSEGNA